MRFGYAPACSAPESAEAAVAHHVRERAAHDQPRLQVERVEQPLGALAAETRPFGDLAHCTCVAPQPIDRGEKGALHAQATEVEPVVHSVHRRPRDLGEQLPTTTVQGEMPEQSAAGAERLPSKGAGACVESCAIGLRRVDQGGLAERNGRHAGGR